MAKFTIPVEIKVGVELIGSAEMTVEIEGRSEIIGGRGIAYPEIVGQNRLMVAFLIGDLPSFLRELADEIEAQDSDVEASG